MSNTNLIHAKRQKNDEFYTQLKDVECEMNAYLDYDPDVFKGKTLLLPCDDPTWSNFTKYFALNFESLGLKKLISTSYSPSGGHGKVFVLDGENKLQWEYLAGDGDFRSAEVTALRDEADIVVTNPPYSLFREFMAWLVEGDVEFAVIGNMNAITYKEIFPLIKDNKVWLGRGKDKGGNSMWFEVPEDYPQNKHERVEDDGTRIIPVSSKWFTNIEHGRRHEPLQLMTQVENQKYNKRIMNNPNSYKKYDNYDAIEVPSTSGIPSDYTGVMGVPISFLDKYCPEQFEILGLTTGRSEFDEVSYPTKRYVNAVQHNTNGTTSNGSKVNTRATIVDENPTSTYYTADNQNKPMTIVYARILIRHINPVTQDIQLAQVHTLKTATPEPQQMAA